MINLQFKDVKNANLVQGEKYITLWSDGSVEPVRYEPNLADWFKGRMVENAVMTHVIPVSDIPLPEKSDGKQPTVDTDLLDRVRKKILEYTRTEMDLQDRTNHESGLLRTIETLREPSCTD